MKKKTTSKTENIYSMLQDFPHLRRIEQFSSSICCLVTAAGSEKNVVYLFWELDFSSFVFFEPYFKLQICWKANQDLWKLGSKPC